MVAATDSSLHIPDYQNIWDPTRNMFEELSHNAKFYILTISITSLVGSGVLIWIIDYIPRKTWLVSSFLLLSIWFAVLGGVLMATEFTEGHVANVVLYAFCQFLFNLGESIAPVLNFSSNNALKFTGPNTLTYIVSTSMS